MLNPVYSIIIGGGLSSLTPHVVGRIIAAVREESMRAKSVRTESARKSRRGSTPSGHENGSYDDDDAVSGADLFEILRFTQDDGHRMTVME
jgi:hypothetical protein